MRNIFKILLFSIVIISCSKHEDNLLNFVENDPLITKLNINFINSVSVPYNQIAILNFKYDTNQKLIKKIGGFRPIPTTTGFSDFFTDEIYTSLTYTNNSVTVENFSSSTDFSVLKNTVYFTLNSLNQIETKEIPNSNNYLLKKQMFNYVNNRLSEIKTYFPNRPYDPNDYLKTYLEKFYYDTNGNLTKTEYFEQHNGINEGTRIIKTFENYDNSINPTKRLQLLDEFFYRSLSKNNFRKYTENQYYNDVLGTSITSTWTFNYSSNGNIILEN